MNVNNFITDLQLRPQRRMISKNTVDSYLEKIKAISDMSAAEKDYHEVWAVAAGAHVSYSSIWDHNHIHYQLDYTSRHAMAWIAAEPFKPGEWIQVSQEFPKIWTGIITQGRGDGDQWVTEVKIAYTLNGKQWFNLQKGKTFKANNDRTTKTRINFAEPVFARSLKIYPYSWLNGIALRLEAIYIDLE